jgi:hypothetical protein
MPQYQPTCLTLFWHSLGVKSFTDHDEIFRYLAEDVISIKPQDMLAWWASKKAVYPCLSRMALDYLSIPGM